MQIKTPPQIRIHIKLICKIHVFLFLFFIDIVIGQQSLQSRENRDTNGIKTIQIVGHSISRNAVNFACLYGVEDSSASIRVSFPFTDVVRVKIHQGGEPFTDEIGQPFDIQHDENSFQLKTDSLLVDIQKQPWQLTISHINGDIIFFQIPEQSGYINSEGGIQTLRIAAAMLQNEGFFGFGEKFNGMNQRGKKVVMEISDAYVEEGVGTYKAIPFFISSARYGLLVNSALPVVYNLGDKNDDFYSFENPDNEIDYFVFSNKDPLTIIQQYTDIVGKTRLVPKWSLEPWLSRRSMTGWNNTATAEADVDMLLYSGYPFGVILWEGIRNQFGKKQIPNMNTLSDKWHSQGLKQVFWSLEGHISKSLNVFKDANPNYFVRNNDSTFSIGGFKGGHAYIDPTNSDAMRWWIKTFYEPYINGEDDRSVPEHTNLDGIKIDFCELFPKYNSPLLMKKSVKGIENVHSVLFSEQIYDWLQQAKPEGGITWIRGGGLGIQRSGFAWGGDRRRTFPQLKGTVSASLSLAVCGVALAGHDLGGYIGGNSPNAREVYIRGVQYATFSPSFHDHGSAPAPWEQDEYGQENYKFYAHIRYNLIPYLYHLVKIAHEKGIPLMRPLFLHYPDDENAYTIDDEYLLSDALLIAPFIHAGTTREVYLPEGEWIDFWTETTYSGSRTIKYTAPLNRIPVFVKSSSIIPLDLNDNLQIGGPFLQNQKNDLLLTFRAFGHGDAKLSFYENKNKINISTNTSGDERQFVVENINHDFGLFFMANRPETVIVNDKEINYLNEADFSVKNNGWTYDAENLKVLVKIKGDDPNCAYVIRISGLDKEKYTSMLKERFEISGLSPKPPKILSVEIWNESVNIHFQPVDSAFAYTVEYGFTSDELNKKLINVAESPVTISNVPIGKSIYVSMRAQNEWGTSNETSPVLATRMRTQKTVFSLENGSAFLRGNHYNSKTISDSGTSQFLYSIIVPEPGTYQFWIKAKKNIGHHLYFRWYHCSSIKLKKGINSIQLIIQDQKTEIDKLYLTSSKKERPIMQSEIEAKISEEKIIRVLEKVIVRF
ncbi:MAG: TIM-barrel domain-containing protein [Bacteroidota bacterium]